MFGWKGGSVGLGVEGRPSAEASILLSGGWVYNQETWHLYPLGPA